LEEASGEHK